MDRAIDPIMKAFTDTAAYLKQEGAIDSGGGEAAASAESDLPEDDEEETVIYGGARVGDLIQWEARGALQLEKPGRVRLVTEDGQWVAVEGSETGIPMSEVIVQERAPTPPPAPPRFSIEAAADKPAEGETEWIRTDLGRDTKVRLIVKGDMGPKQIGKLIKLLKAQQAVLSDEEDDVEEP